MKGLLDSIQTLRLELQETSALTEEDLIILAHTVGSLHSELLERVEQGASYKRKESYKKRPIREDDEIEKCSCGGKQKPSYYVKQTKVCPRCYNKFKKNKQ